MKKFKFSLQSVHELREAKREQEQIKLGELQNQLADARKRLDETQQMRRRANENYAAHITGGNRIDAFELELTVKYLKALENYERQLVADMEKLKWRCRQQSETVTFAAREVEATSKLRERQMTRHKLETNRAEQTTLDELAAITFARRLTQTG
jgi:flagellar export protein FliJ